MSGRLRTADALLALRQLLTDNVRIAADENILVARDEQPDLHPWLRPIADTLRAEGGPGTLIRVDALVERAMAEAEAAWNVHNPPDNALDHVWLAKAEIEAIEADDPDLGALTWVARELVLSSGLEPGEPADLLATVQAWFEADVAQGPRSREGLDGGTQLQAGPGEADRGQLSPELQTALDFYLRLEERELGSVRLDRGSFVEHEVFVITCTTSGRHAFVEIWTTELLAGARFFDSGGPVWDDFAGRVRLSPVFTSLEGFAFEEGYSEADERDAHGQTPSGWGGEVQLTEGWLHPAGRLLGRLDPGAIELSEAQRDLAVAAFNHLYEWHLRHTVWDERPIELGSRRQGVLTIGAFTRSTDGQSYLAADWRDIDDGSFVLYFQQGEWGPVLRSSQFDN